MSAAPTAHAVHARERRATFGDLTNRRVGLVLGAGGATGMAFHAGTLLALSNDFGWDPRNAAAIVGTSAGSVIATLLRGGLSTDDLAAWCAEVDPSPGGESYRAMLAEAESIKPRLRRQGLTTSGFVDARPGLAAFAALHDRWPDDALWINAVRRHDGRRVVFGRDLNPDLGDAVAASCAIPGLFTPVRIGRHAYVDGAAHSPTNADVLRDTAVDTVVVLSPMSMRQRTPRRHPDRMMRAAHRQRLRGERSALRRAGIEVHIFEPDDATLQVMGANALDRRRAGRVVRESFLNAAS